MRIRVFLFSFFLVGVHLYAQQDNSILLKINGEELTTGDFLERFYQTNAKNEKLNEEDVRSYLDLFVNYKLKLAEAHDLGLDTLPNYLTEIRGYYQQLSEPYLRDSAAMEQMQRRAYERLREWVRASHILIKIPENSVLQDTVEFYQRAMHARQRLLNGEDFEVVAMEMSEDPSVSDYEDNGTTYKGNKGDMGYFSGFEMVSAFEDACYNMSKGELSMPVRTTFGYHIIKLHDRILAPFYFLDLSHIWVSAEREGIDPKHRIEEVVAKLKAGENFAQLAKEYSDDQSSADQGGSLKKIVRAMLPTDYVDQILKLKEGEVSQAFETPYGWHIVRVDQFYAIDTYEQILPSIQEQVKRDGRAMAIQDAQVEKIKQEYGYTFFPENFAEFCTHVDDSLLYRLRIIPEWKTLSSKPIFRIGTASFTFDDFVSYISFRLFKDRDQMETFRTTESHFLEAFKSWEKTCCMEYERKHLENKHPDLKKTMREYREGILIFDISNKKVWRKSITDSAGLTDFYEQHKNRYMWEERKDITIWTIDENLLSKDVAFKIIEQGFRKKKTNNQIAKQLIKKAFNKKERPNPEKGINFVWGKYEAGDDALIDQAEKRIGVQFLTVQDGKLKIAIVHALCAPEVKTLEEAKGMATSEYQEFLERTWIKHLREHYSYEINQDALDALLKK